MAFKPYNAAPVTTDVLQLVDPIAKTDVNSEITYSDLLNYGAGSQNIIAHGADPTGVSDSYAAIQSAIDAAWSNIDGGGVRVPTGVYLISQPLNLRTKTRLYGDGFGSIIRCNFGAGVSIPNMSGLGISGLSLSFAPMIYNATPIQWWAIENIQFDGNNKDCYGIWLGSAYYGDMVRVNVLNTNKRPYTLVETAMLAHRSCRFYNCGDGVLGWKSIMAEFSSCGVERCAGTHSFNWRVPDAGYPGVLVRNMWFEGDDTRIPTTSFMAMSGYGPSVDTVMFSNYHASATPRSIYLLPDSQALSVDGLSMTCMTSVNGSYANLHRIGATHPYLGTGARGNSIFGYIQVASVTNDSGNAMNNDLGIASVTVVGASNTNNVGSLA